MCPGIAIFAGVPLVSLSCFGVYKYTDGTIREALQKKLGQVCCRIVFLPLHVCICFMHALVRLGVQKMDTGCTIDLSSAIQEVPDTTPSFYVGAGAAVLSYNVTKQSILVVPAFRDGGRLGSPSEIKTWMDFWKATGPRACATVIALVGSFVAAGAVRPYVDASTLMPREEGPKDRK